MSHLGSHGKRGAGALGEAEILREEGRRDSSGGTGNIKLDLESSFYQLLICIQNESPSHRCFLLEEGQKSGSWWEQEIPREGNLLLTFPRAGNPPPLSFLLSLSLPSFPLAAVLPTPLGFNSRPQVGRGRVGLRGKKALNRKVGRDLTSL